jgi:hypothetical protein
MRNDPREGSINGSISHSVRHCLAEIHVKDINETTPPVCSACQSFTAALALVSASGMPFTFGSLSFRRLDRYPWANSDIKRHLPRFALPLLLPLLFC